MSGQVRVIVLGALGRMGRAILDALSTDRAFALKGAVVREKAVTSGQTLAAHGLTTFGQLPVMSALPKGLTKRDVVVDVTRAESVLSHVEWVERIRTPYVLAVTGLDRKTEDAVKRASKKIPIVRAPNLSVGVAVLHEISWIAAALLPGAEIEIVETHHRYKKDKPSGTALSLARSIEELSARKKGAIPIHSIRGGDVVGEHEIHLMMDGERINLTHIATSRAIFARGALKAARFVIGKKPGIYTMHDVLGLGKGKA